MSKARQKYDSNAAFYEWSMNSFRYASSLRSLVASLPVSLPRNSKILELGCGSGIATEVLQNRFPDARIVGVDFSTSMLELCKPKLPSVELISGDFNDISSFRSFPTNNKVKLPLFDFVFSTGAASEYGDLSKVIPLAYKFLKKGGVFINIGIKKNIVGLVQGKLWHFTPVGRSRVINACKSAGFSSVELVPVSWRFFPTSYVKFVVKCMK